MKYLTDAHRKNEESKAKTIASMKLPLDLKKVIEQIKMNSQNPLPQPKDKTKKVD